MFLRMGWSSWCLFLVLLYLSWSWSSECQETNNIRLPSSKEDHHHGHIHVDDHHHGPSSPHAHPDHSIPTIFININDLKVGLTKPIYFPKNKKPSPPFLQRQLGPPNSDPLSIENLPNLLRLFSVPQGSPQAKTMESTLLMCVPSPIEDEIRLCVTSFDSMAEFVRGVFGLAGLGHGFTFLTTLFDNGSNTRYQNYTILEDLREIPIPKMVACHLMEFPYAVYGCHIMAKDRKLYKMSLSGQNGDRVETIVVCHLDTSEWEPEHPSFKVLGFGPGMGPVCHFFSEHDFVWIPSSISV
ncbi:BURP domain-containing protein 6-like [Humulus lupulus]|uniref:BURP domain-containing protein 6-like n=1 Tax=Humulus lupulus TaxID=3486 RepID=UPI002B41045F|nr:BURP domain-containing protein 6-like [Humulus lupulus]